MGLEQGELPFTSIEETAAYHLQSIQARSPDVPRVLGGYSFGGLVAFEIARQLAARGHPPSLLFILDIQAAGSPRQTHTDGRTAGEPALDRLEQDLRRALVDQAEFQSAVAVLKENMRAMTRYRPSTRLATEIVLVRAATRRPEFAFLPGFDETRRDPTWGWSALTTQGIKVHVIPGDHFSLMTQPFVAKLADIVAERLSDDDPRIASTRRPPILAGEVDHPA
jgi:thioesterase domain-containing protein